MAGDSLRSVDEEEAGQASSEGGHYQQEQQQEQQQGQQQQQQQRVENNTNTPTGTTRHSTTTVVSRRRPTTCPTSTSTTIIQTSSRKLFPQEQQSQNLLLTTSTSVKVAESLSTQQTPNLQSLEEEETTGDVSSSHRGRNIITMPTTNTTFPINNCRRIRLLAKGGTGGGMMPSRRKRRFQEPSRSFYNLLLPYNNNVNNNNHGETSTARMTRSSSCCFWGSPGRSNNTPSSPFLSREMSSLSSSSLSSLASEDESPIHQQQHKQQEQQHSWFDSNDALKFLYCFCGLQIFYLSWAYLQELIMTTEFQATFQNPQGKFPSASFCVFCNRCVALSVALIAVKIRHGAFFSNNKAPVSVFVPCAISNTLSSICQYASLKHVSFPLMTVFKSSTIIPVMIMGYLIKGSTYPRSHFIEAALITVGVILFSMSSSTNESDTAAVSSASSSTTLFGMSLLMAYVTFDSFTTQWQHGIYSKYGRENVDPYQMMLGVDTTAILFTTVSLVGSGELPVVWEFFQANPHVLLYNILCPIMSTCGQLCIFYTLKEFGPLVFTIIMTTRKFVSICISLTVFGHSIHPSAALGGGFVLVAILSGVRRMCAYNNINDNNNTSKTSKHKKQPQHSPPRQLQQQQSF